MRPITWSDRIKDPQDSPLKFNFTSFGDIRFGPRLTEVPRFRSNRLRAEGCEFNPHRRHFFSCRPVAVNEHFRNMKRTKRQRFYGQRYTPQGYDYK